MSLWSFLYVQIEFVTPFTSFLRAFSRLNLILPHSLFVTTFQTRGMLSY